MIPQTPSVASEVFQIEELALHVFKAFNGTQDRVSLALTSSYLFRSLVPQLWERVYGIDRLFALIPGTSLEKDTVSTGSSERPHRRLIIVIPEPPYHDGFSRFNMYCSFVKHLDITRFDVALDLRNSDAISSFANPGRILFPNLLSLTHNTSAGYYVEQIRWLSELVSPRLQSFRLSISQDLELAFATPEDHNTILDKLAQRCPHLQDLDLSIYPRGLGSRNIPDANRRMWLEHPFRISRMATLRKLTVSGLYVTAGGLEAFGTLPLLDTLKFTLVALPQPELLPNTLPEGSYPSLVHLFLLPTQNSRTLARIWKLFARTKKLTHLEVDYWLPFTDQAQHDVVSVLIRERSRLEDLTLRQSLGRMLGDLNAGVLLTVEPLSIFPLRTLRISVSEKAPLDVDNLLDQLRRATFPSLRKFSISGVSLTFELLAAFAQSMPQLEHLNVQIDFASVNTIPLSVGHASSTFHTLRINIWDDMMEIIEKGLHPQFLDSGNDTKVIRFLSALWRNAQVKIDTTWVILNEKRKLELEEASRAAELLNQGIALLANPPI